MTRFARFRYAPVAPLGKDGRCVTASARHLAVSKEAAIEGAVLLKNEKETLPLKKGAKVCLFGRGAGEYIFGGGGSGSVVTDIKVSLADALEKAAEKGELELFQPLIDFSKEESRKVRDEVAKLDLPRMEKRKVGTYLPLEPFEIPAKMYKEAVAFGDVAIFSILRYSTEGTTDGDRMLRDFKLFDSELAQLKQLGKDFKKVIAVLCICGPMGLKELKDEPSVGAILYPGFGGSFAGEAIVEILFGKRYPSGHLQDTFAETIEDYPTTETYIASDDYVEYKEDIFVGYRYFETFAPEKVVYPFGFGLGYTKFNVKEENCSFVKNTVSCTVTVKNTGSFAGKEVVQLYLSAPQGLLGKAKKVLCAFKKTKELQPGESQKLTLTFDIRSFASFDDLGKIEKSAFVLEKGEYKVYLGNNVRDSKEVYSFEFKDDVITRRAHSYMAPVALEERLTASGKMEKLPKAEKVAHPPRRYRLKAKKPAVSMTLEEALAKDKVDEFLADLSDEELAAMLYGHTAVNATQTGYIGCPPPASVKAGYRDPHDIPPVPTCDGPAGCRTVNQSGISTTYFPAACTVSQSWNLALAEKCGKTGAKEVKENNAGIWLTPGMNLHRSPLCGRNFEYYSEDPLATGLFAAATVKGIQSQHVAATVKHFCCNNKEINRKFSDSRVSERALRELYLRGFEICVKKADPWCIMTSYNVVNGTRNSSNWELINGILKGEWKYPGLVMTDWWTYCTLEEELAGGNDVKMPHMITKSMPGAPEDYSLAEAIAQGKLDRGAVLEAVRRVLHLMSHFE
ncbi:MAG: glycoside hydrolase family 3 C-terminal domain-containing protein [Clostridia bacterium]|nr:glycoside hydrolase family 3 C-terminal domain-containing protein [Clostridia bacterium]